MMMRERIVAMGLVSMFLIVQPIDGHAQNARTITVDGHAEIRVVPSQVVLTVGIETFDGELASAKADNDKRVTALLDVAESLGVGRKDVRTEYLNIQPQFKDHQDRGNFLRYLVRRTVVITLRDIQQFETLLSSLLEAGVNYVHGVEFQTTELTKHRDEAQARAIEAAKHKAETIAGRLGQRIGEPHSIRVSDAGWQSSYGHWGIPRGRQMTHNIVVDVEPTGGPLEGPTTPGQISVTARVTVSFRLMDQ